MMRFSTVVRKTGILLAVLLLAAGNAVFAQKTLYDFGDAPNPYPTILNSNGAYHKIVAGFYLGNKVDDENDGIPSSDGKGDDNNNTDDEDGVSFSTLIKGSTATIVVTASASGTLNAWLDFNDDGDWADAGEHIFSNQALSAGNNTLNISVPSGAAAGYTFARFRFNSNGGISYTGYGYEGEVEDYLVTITDSSPPDSYDFGDAPAPYPTLLNEGGARHTIAEGIYLGQGVDADTDGQPDSTATGDDNDGNDDEDGIELLQELVPGDTALVRITASSGGYLKAWFDWNQDGDWDDAGEEAADTQVGAGANDIGIVVPADAKEGNTFARFRYSENTIPGATGLVTKGEVEDMQFYIENFHFFDYGDAPDDDIYHYPTLRSHNGARHTVSDTIYLVDRGSDLYSYMPGTPPDLEGNGQPTLNARGDNDTDLDDEKGILFWMALTPGEASMVIVSCKGTGTLHGWFDWNRDGDWADAGEYVINYNNTHGTGIYPVNFNVPETAELGNTYARFRYSVDPLLTPYGRGGNGEVEDYLCTVTEAYLDYGDAPDSYGTLEPDGACHRGNILIFLGTTYTDNELDGSPDPDALGDDTDGHDDEDGVVFSELIPGEESSFEITTWGNYTSPFYPLLHGWIDFNHDGDFNDAGEKIFDGITTSDGTNTYRRLIPADVHIGYTYARFRYSDDDALPGSDGPSSHAGEVEDYRVRIGKMMFDYGDAPWPFPTLRQQGGARHMIDPEIYLGSGVDADEDGTPDSTAMGDFSSDQNDDDDGVSFKGAWVLGDTVTAVVSASQNGFLGIWCGYPSTGNGQNSKPLAAGNFVYEATKIQVQAGVNEIDISVEDSLFHAGTAYIRFRYSTLPIDSVGGDAINGEVEDYRINIFDRLEILYEYGDAPENAEAYPHLGVTGQFPTFEDITTAGFVRHGTAGTRQLGWSVDYETDGNAGVLPPFGGDYDQDEGMNDVRTSSLATGDIGLISPHAYTIRETGGYLHYWAYSAYHQDKGVLGETGELVHWGYLAYNNYLDIHYSVTDPDGAYLNILIDWNQNGTWGDTDEHVLQNFPIPAGTGKVSDLSPPQFTIGNTEGFAWMRVTLSDTPVASDWDGSGTFSDGETEDYLICVSYDGMYDYGDAPEGALAYPSTGVTGQFPTGVNVTGEGYIRHAHGGDRYFGYSVDYEYEGNAGFSPLFTGFYDADEDFHNTLLMSYKWDAGLRGVFPHHITGSAGSETVVAYDDGTGLPETIGSIGQIAAWGVNLDLMTVINMHETGAYINVAIDWNQDGDWKDIIDPGDGSPTIPERVLRNFYISDGGLLSTKSPPTFRIGPNAGYAWMRCTITKTMVEHWGWDGSGDFVDGETEDYLIKIDDYSDVFDFGDVPSRAYGVLHVDGGAIHTIQSGFHLGNYVDPDPDGQPGPGGSGDDNDGMDDDDGVSFPKALIPGQTMQLQVTASGSGILNAWIDFNADSSWDDAGEQIVQDGQLSSGTNLISIAVPASAAPGITYARFRFSDTGGLSYDGPAHFSDYPDQLDLPPIGEVEDYAVLISTADTKFDFGDAPDPPYPTLWAGGGAMHKWVSGYMLGNKIDSENDGQPNNVADGDDIAGDNDDDGIFFTSPLSPGTGATLTASASDSGFINAWIDFNSDGDWLDGGEQIFINQPLHAGNNFLNYSIPDSAFTDSVLFARFRFNAAGGLTFNGPAADGEVEDYLINVNVTDVSEKDQYIGIPGEFELLQNYPNPFNPETTVRFTVKKACNVTLKVYSILGEEMAVLTNKRYEAGSHIVVFNAKGLSSGIYFYRIEMGGYKAVRKMIFLK